MRRYHAAPRILAASTYSKQADLAFLLQQPQPPKRQEGSVGHAGHGARVSRLSNTQAMKMLSNAVQHKKYAKAEQLFSLAPGLGTRQAALRLLIKMYCEQHDFTTAKAILVASLDKVGHRGVARFIAHCTFGSQNTADIEDVYTRWCTSNEPTPDLAGIALLGTRFLDDREGFNRVWSKTAEFWEPSLKAPTLMAKVLDLMLREDWEEAFRVWRIASGMGSFVDVRPLQVFYFACRYFLVEQPSIDAVNMVLKLLRRAGLGLNTQFTTLLLRHLAPMFPESPVSYWITAAQQRDWPLVAQSVEVLIYALSKRFESTPGFAKAIYQYGIGQMRNRHLSVGRHLLAEAPSRGNDLTALQGCKTDIQVLEYLRSMLLRGLRIPYYHFVVAFRLLAKWRSPKLTELVTLIQEQGYPVHCAGIDLAVIELQCREVGYNQLVCRELISSYLAQYPLIGHNRSELTQLGLILWHAKDYPTAIALVDSIRAEQAGHQKYTSVNHDSASLQLILRCRFKMKEALVPFMRSVLADRPQILFDREFSSNLSKMLDHRSEDKDILTEIGEHNRAVKEGVFTEANELVKLAVENISLQQQKSESETTDASETA